MFNNHPINKIGSITERVYTQNGESKNNIAGAAGGFIFL